MGRTKKNAQLPPLETLIKFNDDGIATSVIAKQMRVSYATVLNWYAKNNLERVKAKDTLRLSLGIDSQKLMDLENQGLTVLEIAKVLNVSHVTLRKWFRLLGLPKAGVKESNMRKSSITKELLEDYVAQKMTRQEIADKHSVSRNTVDNLYEVFGIEKPSRSLLFKEQYVKKLAANKTTLEKHIQEKAITPELLHELNAKALTTVEIAKLWGVNSPNTVKAWYDKLGVSRVGRLEMSLIKYNVTEDILKNLIAEGRTYRQIAEQFSVSSNTAFLWCRHFNLRTVRQRSKTK